MNTISASEGTVAWLNRDLRLSAADERRSGSSLHTIEDTRQYDRLALDDPDNLMGQKILNHIARVPLWLQASLEAKPEELEYAQAKFLFGALKRVSGVTKNVIMFQSRTQEEFTHDITCVDNMIPFYDLMDNALSKASDLGDVTPEEFISIVSKTATDDVDRFDRLFPIESTLYYGRQASKPVKYNLNSAEDWLTVTFVGLRHFAKQNDGLENVAILEPKSISASPEPVPLFPFRHSAWTTYDSENPAAIAS
jgi:hypothetical protein